MWLIQGLECGKSVAEDVVVIVVACLNVTLSWLIVWLIFYMTNLDNTSTIHVLIIILTIFEFFYIFLT